MNPKLRNLKSKLQKVEEFGRKYRQKYLIEYIQNQKRLRAKKPEELLSDWRKALYFFLSRVFPGGRRDELSEKYLNRAWGVIKGWSPNREWNRDSLLSSLEKAKVEKKADRIMVADTLELIPKKSEFNIIQYFRDSINEKKKLKEIFEEIKEEIYNIGNKKATLALRDTVDLFHLEKDIPKEEFTYLQPIDTYVHKAANKLGIINSEKPNQKDWEEDSKAIVNSCLEHRISSIKFNQGAWYLGKNSFDILINNLTKL